MKPHVLEKLPKAKKEKHGRIAYVVCRRCGLVALRNKPTEAALRKACPGLEDPVGVAA